MTKEEVLKQECPLCKAWKGQPCKSSNRALGHQPTTVSSKPISRPHTARVRLALSKSHLRLVK
jgi:hypothetical protein